MRDEILIGVKGSVLMTRYSNMKSRAELLDFHEKRKRTPSGIIMVDKHNLIVNTGQKTIAHLLGNDPSAAPVQYIAFGSGGGSGGSFTAPEVTDYKLNTEKFREPVAYTFNDGAPEFSVTFTAAALADEHPDVTSISEAGLMTRSTLGDPNASTMDLVAYITFPEVFFSATAPVGMGLVVEWKIVLYSAS